MTTHKNLCIVFIHGTFMITDGRHVLDDHSVVGVLVLLVEDVISGHHVVDDIALANLLRTELLRSIKVKTIVVTKEVEAGDGSELDSSVDEEVDQSRFHLSLA